jgi:hypothetical protein
MLAASAASTRASCEVGLTFPSSVRDPAMGEPPERRQARSRCSAAGMTYRLSTAEWAILDGMRSADDLATAVAAAVRAVRTAFNPAGVLVQQHSGVAAFQTVPHVHFHVIPKTAGPFPPAEPAELVPFGERARQAGMIQRHWITRTRR